MTRLEIYELIINSMVVGMVLYPAFQHLILYLKGRKIRYNKETARSNLFLSVYAFSLSLAIFSESLILSKLFNSNLILKIEACLAISSTVILLLSMIKFLLSILECTKNKKKTLFINILSLLLILLGLSEIVVIILVEDYLKFLENYWIIFLLAITLYFIILASIIVHWTITMQKYKKREVKYILVAFILGGVNFCGASLLYAFDFSKYFVNNYILIGFSTLMISYALSLKANEENKKRISLEVRNDIFGVVSHELKTPLSLIVNYLSQAKQDNRLIELVSDEFNRLLKRFKDMLYFDALNRDYYSYNNDSALDIVGFTKKKIEVSRPTADKRNLVFELDIESEDTFFVNINSQAFDMILNNLIENALKYSPANSKIRLKVYTSDDKVFLLISNSTFKIIPEELKSRVFGRFEQHERRIDGSVGVGLYTTKNIIDKIKGANIEISTSSEKSFEVKVSFEKGMEKSVEVNDYDVKPVDIIVTPEVKLKPEPKYNERKQTIFIVEDNPGTINLLIDYFKKDFNVCYATNGLIGLDRIAALAGIDLIISDVMMPEIDGITFFRKVRKTDGFEHIPFIFHTAKTDDISKVTALDLGAIDYIDKTSNPEELKFKVRNLLKNYEIREKAIRYEFTQLFKDEEIIDKYKKYGITERELEIVSVVVNLHKKSYFEIGKIFDVGKTTISGHVYNVARKIGSPTHRETFTELFNKLE